MTTDSTSPAEITRLIADLESWNATLVRETAIAKAATIGVVHGPLVEALSRLARESPYSDFGKAALAAIDSMYVSSRMKRSATPRRVMTTSVEITSDDGPGLEVADTKAYCRCNFCGKDTVMTAASRRFTERLSGPERFYCTFCLRHRLNQRDSRHTLILSYRGIIGYYYHAFYAMSKGVNMTISEIWDYVNLHAHIGTQNPLFLYDPESFLWFIDFTRVGNSHRKMSINDVLGSAGEILLAFALHENIKDVKPHKMYLRYEEAIFKFYHQRSRPANMRILSPTLRLTGASEYSGDPRAKDSYTTITSTTVPGNDRKKIPIDETRNFLPQVLHDALGRKY